MNRKGFRPVLAIDPGNRESAFVIYDGWNVLEKGLVENGAMLSIVQGKTYPSMEEMIGVYDLAIEYMKPRGMPTSKEEMDTQFFSGRLVQAWISQGRRYRWHPVYRSDVKMHICESPRAKDSNITQALADRFGPGMKAAKGTKKNPGPLYGVKADIWQALGVAVTWHDQQSRTKGKKPLLSEEQKQAINQNSEARS